VLIEIKSIYCGMNKAINNLKINKMNTQGTENQQVTVNLIDVLKKETKSLKVQYLKFTKEYAKSEFEYQETLKMMQYYERVKFLGYELIEVTDKYNGRITQRFNDEHYRNGDNQRLTRSIDKMNKIVSMGLSKYIEKMEENAILHYEDSIIKLATRIEKKELNKSNLTVKTSHVGVNIETTLTDGIKTVRAFTIIASGEVQKPHYRYLIK